MPCILDLQTGQVVPQKGQTAKVFASLARVAIPDGAIVFGPPVGHVHPPQYANLPDGQTNLPPRFKLYQEQIIPQGSGGVAVDSDPVFDPLADVVTITRTLSQPPKPTVMSFFAFQERFTEAERIAILKWTDQIDPLTNTLIRADWKEKFRRAEVRGTVDLAGPAANAFIDKLITDGVGGINAARKAAILTP